MEKLIRIMKSPDWTMLGGLAGGIMTGMFGDARQANANRVNTERQVKASKELTDYNQRKQIEMWEATGYGPQMEQMRKAGVNPALLYGKGGAGGQTAAVNTGNAGMGSAPSSGGEYVGMVNATMQNALLHAQKENLEANTAKQKAEAAKTAGADTENVGQDTKNKIAQEALIKTQTELQKVDLTVNQNVIWERVNEIVSRSIEQQERGIQAGIQSEIQQATIDDNIRRIKAEAINTGLQGAAIKAGMKLTEEQTRKVGEDILQKWAEIQQGGAKNEWEHHDRLKAIEEYTENALKVAGIMAVGNIVRDVTSIATRRIPKGKSTTTTGPKGTTITDVEYH